MLCSVRVHPQLIACAPRMSASPIIASAEWIPYDTAATAAGRKDDELPLVSSISLCMDAAAAAAADDDDNGTKSSEEEEDHPYFLMHHHPAATATPAATMPEKKLHSAAACGCSDLVACFCRHKACAATTTRSRFVRYVAGLPPADNLLLLDSLKKMRRLRITLMDSLRGVAAEYNRDAGNGTLAELVESTELVARTCVDNLLLRDQQEGTFQKFESLLRSSTEDALAEFYVQLCSLLVTSPSAAQGGTERELAEMLRDVKLLDAIECCQEVARDHVREMLGLLDIDRLKEEGEAATC